MYNIFFWNVDEELRLLIDMTLDSNSSKCFSKLILNKYLTWAWKWNGCWI